MSRIHNNKKGRSSSTKPLRKASPEWMGITEEEIINTVVKLNSEGRSPSRIGMVLRDQYAVPDVKLATNKSITQILADKGIKMEMPQDLMDLIKRAVSLSKHVSENPKDLHNKRGLQLMESKIRRLAKYYKREGVLSGDWKYSLDAAKLLVE